MALGCGLVLAKGRRACVVYKVELINKSEDVFILANQRSSVIWLEDFPALITECMRTFSRD